MRPVEHFQEVNMGGGQYNTLYVHWVTPNENSCYATNGSSTGGWFRDAVTATSNHPGGVNVAFADGSVKFIKDTINLQTWWGIGTRSGGEVLSADAY